MIRRVGLRAEAAALPLSVRVDLYLSCVECSERPRCRDWLEAGKADLGYQAFCPNAWMFDRRRQLRRWQGEAMSADTPDPTPAFEASE
jgi:hypothetical protein